MKNKFVWIYWSILLLIKAIFVFTDLDSDFHWDILFYIPIFIVLFSQAEKHTFKRLNKTKSKNCDKHITFGEIVNLAIDNFWQDINQAEIYDINVQQLSENFNGSIVKIDYYNLDTKKDETISYEIICYEVDEKVTYNIKRSK